jgi:ABC-type transport system involved in cytochrome c biogenesis permease component
LAAVAPRWFADQSPVAAFGALGALGLYVLAAGVVLGVRLRAEYRGENLGYAPGRREIAQPETGWQLGGSGLIAAAIEKELRALSRTLPLLYALGAPLLLVLIFSGSFLRATSRGHIFPLALPLSLVYAQLGFTQFFYNNLGVEGGGIQMLFLSPAPIRTVILAKNLFHALLYALMLLVAGILATLRLGLPDGTMAAATVAWLSFSLPCNLAAGNVVSLMLPYRMNPGRMMRQRGSRANALLGLLAQTIVLGVGATVFALCLHSHRLWLAVPIFLALAGAAFYALASVLCKIDGIANRRRDLLIATLAKKE